MADINDLQERIDQAIAQKEEAQRNMDYYRTMRTDADNALQAARDELETLKNDIDNAETQAASAL